MKYWNDYPREQIAKNNPYKCCSYCKISDPVINGSLENHMEWCEFRRKWGNHRYYETFWKEREALAYKSKLEEDPTFCPDSNYVKIVQKFVR